jgi:hypothetical protein
MIKSDDPDASGDFGSSPPPIPPRWPVVDKRSTHYDDGTVTPSARPPEAQRPSWRGPRRPLGRLVLIFLIVAILVALTVFLTLR